MVLTLYGSPVSTCTKRVAVVLKEKDIPFTFVPIDLMKGEHKDPEYLKKQPFGQVPYIVSLQDIQASSLRLRLLLLYIGR